MSKEYSAGIVVYRKKNNQLEYLLLHYNAGHWDFPKGHIEAGENKEQAALRELKEEAGLRTTINPNFFYEFSYSFTKDGSTQADKTVYFFVGQASDNEVKLSHEHKGFEWLPFNQASKKITYKNAQELLCEVHVFLSE